MTIFFTADQHLGHANIIKYCDRPFANTEAMDAVIINRWNYRVSYRDEVYVLGDFTMRANLHDHYISQLNGKKHFIPGGHDHAKIDYMDPIVELKTKLGWLILSHYPLEEWNRQFYGAIHLHGHVHNLNFRQIPHRINVGVDLWDFYPVSYEEIVDKDLTTVL